MDYHSKYLKYKSKYLTLRNKLQVGGTTLDEFRLSPGLTPFQISLAELIDANLSNDDIEWVYNILYTIGENRAIKFNIINTDINNILTRYPGNNEIRYYKNDIPYLVLVFDTIVIKIAQCIDIHTMKHQQLYDLLLQNQCPYLEHIHEVHINEYNNLYYVVSQKIDDTLFKERLAENEIIIKTHILNGLRYLYDHGWNHNDTRIDNIGYDSATNTYRLYDFGLTKNIPADLRKTYLNDQRKLNVSFNIYLGRPNELEE